MTHQKSVSSIGVLLLCTLLSAVSLPAQDSKKGVSPALFDAMKYRSVGPTRGGRVTAVAGIPQQPFTFYMGATGGGVWKTDDAGTTWRNITDGQIAVGSIGAIAVSESDQNVVYVGTGSAAPRGNISIGNGMYKSTDAGVTWRHIGLPKAGLIGRICVHPNNPDLVYVAVLGNIFGPNQERGVYRSDNGGMSWSQVLSISDKTGAVDLSMDRQNPRILYAAMWQAQRKPWTLIDGGDEGGIYKSVDGGDTWNQCEGGLPTGLLGKIGVSVSPANGRVVYAVVQHQEKGGVYVSKDAGKSWNRVNDDRRLRQRGWYYSRVTADPVDEHTVYLSNTALFRSTDGGRSLTRIRTPHGDDHGVWVNPNHPTIMVNGNDGGANVTLNGGRTWSTQHNQPTAEFYRLTVDHQFPYRLYAGQQDNSSISVSSRRPRGLTPFQDWFDAGGSESAEVAVDHSNPNIIYATTYSGEITVMNRATGQVREISAYPHYTEGTEQRNLKYRWQWNAPVVVSPFNPKEIYHLSNYVHRSTNAGQSWEIISPDLTQALDQYHGIPGGPIQHDATGVESYSTIFAFAMAADEPGVMWTGSDDGLIHITRNNGQDWQNVTPKKMPEEGTVNEIALSTHGNGRAFVAVFRYRDGDPTPYIFMTNNYGRSWRLLTDGKNGIPKGHFVRSVAEDPDRKGLLYAGTEFGMYVSFNEGKHWQSLQLNLPAVPITDIEVHQKDLVLSTQGRSFWILDDLSPLHQIQEATSTEPNLFKPRDAYRTNIGGFLPVFNFYLPEVDPNADYRIQITDASGMPVRTYGSKLKDKQKLEVKKGHNQQTWDLRYPGPAIVPDMVSMVLRPNAPGPWAVPGTYRVTLKIDDWEKTQMFEVKADPRWTDVTVADYRSLFDLTIEMRDMMTQSHQVIRNLRAVRKQVTLITELTAQAGANETVQQAVTALDTKLTAVEDRLIQNKAKSTQDAINFPRVFSNHIGRLYLMAVYAQAKPTGGMLERYNDLKAAYGEIVAAYRELIAVDLPEMTRILKQEKADGLLVPFTIE